MKGGFRLGKLQVANGVEWDPPRFVLVDVFLMWRCQLQVENMRQSGQV